MAFAHMCGVNLIQIEQANFSLIFILIFYNFYRVLTESQLLLTALKKCRIASNKNCSHRYLYITNHLHGLSIWKWTFTLFKRYFNEQLL